MHPQKFLALLDSDSPFQPPNWRHQLVVGTIDSPRLFNFGADDAPLQTYRRFIGALRAAGVDEDERQRVFDAFPAMGGAFQIYHAADPGDRRLLEARLMSPTSLEEIADRSALGVDAARAFEEIFFNVRHRLGAKFWVHCVLLRGAKSVRSAANVHMSDESRWYPYRFFAYYGGLDVLDVALGAMLPAEKPQNAKELAQWFASNSAQKLEIAAIVELLQCDLLDPRFIKRSLERPETICARRSPEEEAQLEEIADAIERQLGIKRDL